jgi:deoxycytidine triphosphate deaminase
MMATRKAPDHVTAQEITMPLLRDEDLVAAVLATPPLVTGLQPPADWYSRESPIQAASLDLTIGAIYLPGTDPGAPGGVNLPRVEWALDTGQTAVVTTHEELQLPANVAGIGFPPSRVSFRGLLMTNPGHVDPGYKGPLRFTVINMAREPYALKSGDVIVSVLLFKLERDVRAGYAARRPPGYTPPPPSREQVDRLAKDFVDVEERSTRIANRAVVKAGLVVALIGTLVAGTFGFVQNFFSPAWKDVHDTKLAVLEKAVQFEKETSAIRGQQARVEALASEVALIKAATCRQRPVPAYCPPAGRP